MLILQNELYESLKDILDQLINVYNVAAPESIFTSNKKGAVETVNSLPFLHTTQNLLWYPVGPLPLFRRRIDQCFIFGVSFVGKLNEVVNKKMYFFLVPRGVNYASCYRNSNDDLIGGIAI